MKNDAGTLLSHNVSILNSERCGSAAAGQIAAAVTTHCSEPLPEYVPVSLAAASLRGPVSEKAVATQVYATRSGVYGEAVMWQLFDWPSGGPENWLWCKYAASLDVEALNFLSGKLDNAESSAKVRPTRRQF